MDNTQEETIVWHKYPDEKPKGNADYRCQTSRRDGYDGDRIEKFVTMYWSRNKFIDESVYYGILGSPAYEWEIITDSDIIAWAELPEGWKPNEL